ncbi:MAG: CDP-alcohol phosphatidyltransferase family protein [Planctomycetota bacterium]|nr:CDP-alcohol phosphatidyltransferase family protein [Planctomycetota bacterium]
MRIPRVSILPSLCTLGNALCGFGAITFTTKALLASDTAASVFRQDVRWAGYLVIFAMVFDALDGRLARFARATSDFGGQLDSLADAISFGVAPAFLMNRVVVEGLHNVMPAGLVEVLRIAWVCGAVYLGCTLIRLARFNVENVHDEEAHLSFRGLPSPAAAGALVSLIIVMADFWPDRAGGMPCTVMLWCLPAVAVVLGILMVSNLRYSHMLNQLVRGRRPVSHLVLILLTLALAVVLREIILPVGFGAYALSGPVTGIWRRLRKRRARREGQGPPPPEGETPNTPTT